MIPEDVDKILYSDVDVIFNGSLRELEEYEFTDNVSICGVKDLVRYDDYPRLGIDPQKHKYFNAGVMLISLKYWRKNSIREKCLDALRKNGTKYYMPDQDSLNVVLQGTIEYLHPKYNCLSFFSARREYIRVRVNRDDWDKVNEAVSNPAIIHYVFVNKPWYKGEFLPFREKWNAALSKTQWRDMEIKYRKGYKDQIRITLKSAINSVCANLGFSEPKPSIFHKKQPIHIRIFFYILYYALGQYLPNRSTIPYFGIITKLSNKFRVWCVKHIFDFVGVNVGIGRKVKFGRGTSIWIGDNSNIGDNCHVSSDIVIGENVMMGPDCYFFNSHTHRIDDITKPMIQQGLCKLDGHIEIQDDVWIGKECMVLPCKKIGAHSVLGARSLITKDVPEWVVVGGNPAKIIRYRK